MFDPRKEVPSFELCERLKELGYPQGQQAWYWRKGVCFPILGLLINKSEWGWTLLEYINGIWTKSPYIYGDSLFNLIYAPTLQELGMWLPPNFYTTKIGNEWVCCNDKEMFLLTASETEANARAKILIWLKENGHIEFKEN